MNEFIKPEFDEDLNPVDYYNFYKADHSLNLFIEKNKTVKRGSKENTFIIPNNIGVSTEFIFANGFLFTASNNEILQANKNYTPFMLLAKFKFKGNYQSAFSYIEREFLNKNIPYVRVGIDYFKEIKKTDRFGIERRELKRWKKEEIKEDHGKEILKFITKFDSFVIDPNNIEYHNTIGNSYNMYSEFSHQPKKGSWKWTEILLKQVFNGHYEKGLKYLQALYLHPKQSLPILVLGSKERSTGKTTFLNWMAQLFGENYTVITPQEFTGSFNSSYAFCNIIGIEETVDDKAATVNKIKGLSTGKFIPVNQKHIDNYKLPFFGKFIITTNQPERFLKIDTEEIRFWAHILTKPKIKNTNIENDVIKEIPAFLHYLTTLPPLDFSKSRMIFEAKDLETEALTNVKNESKSWLYKEICEHIKNYFDENQDKDEYYCTASELKHSFFIHNNKVELHYLSRVLREDFNKINELKKYTSENGLTKTGRIYTFLRSEFNDSKLEKGSLLGIKSVKETLPF